MNQRKGYIVLYVAPFLMDALMGSISIAVPLLAISLGVSSLTLGTIGFAPGLAYISLCFLFGKLSERWHRKNLVLLGCLGYALASFFLIFSSQIYQLYLSMILVGVGAAMFWPALEVWIAEKENKKPLIRRIGLFNVSWSMGLTIGPLVGGILFGIYLKLPYYFALFVSLCVFFILLWRTQKVSFSTSTRISRPQSSFSEDPPKEASLYIQISRVANFALWFSIGTIRYMFPKLGTELGISPSFLGVLMFTLPLSQTLTFYILGVSSRWHYHIFPLVFSQFIAILGLLVVFIVTAFPLFLLAFVFIGIGIGMTHFSSLFYSINVTFGKGSGAGIHETVLGTGGLLGSLLGGVVAEVFSLRAPYLTAAGLILGAVFIQLLIKKYKDLTLI